MKRPFARSVLILLAVPLVLLLVRSTAYAFPASRNSATKLDIRALPSFDP